jgi:hypothetical protein
MGVASYRDFTAFASMHTVSKNYFWQAFGCAHETIFPWTVAPICNLRMTMREPRMKHRITLKRAYTENGRYRPSAVENQQVRSVSPKHANLHENVANRCLGVHTIETLFQQNICADQTSCGLITGPVLHRESLCFQCHELMCGLVAWIMFSLAKRMEQNL